MNKYRPSDAEIAAVAEVLKDWKMPSGWSTAAVLALDAAGKVRAPKKMKKQKDDQMVKFLDGVVGVIEANSGEYGYIWERNKEYRKAKWEEKSSSGLFEYVGWHGERPVCMSMRIAYIDDHKILFWHATSSLVDHEMIDEWFEVNLPDVHKTDATNWTNAIPRKD